MKTTIVSGNFKVEVEGELNAEKQEAINEAGVTYIVQRDGLSKVYKDLIGDRKGDDGKPAKRNTVEFDANAATKFGSALEAALAPYGTFVAEVSEHVPSEGGESPMVRATTFVDQLVGTPNEAGLRSILGADAGASREDLIKLAHEKRLGVSAPRKPKAEKA